MKIETLYIANVESSDEIDAFMKLKCFDFENIF